MLRHEFQPGKLVAGLFLTAGGIAYAGDAAAPDVAAGVLADAGETRSGYAAYAWYCAGEAEQSRDLERARACYVRALELEERRSR